MFWRWWRMKEEDRLYVWHWVLYGWFSGLMCVGSVFGAVTWAFWMQLLVALFTSNSTPGLSLAQRYSLSAQVQYWGAAFYVTYAIEFLCLSVAKLLVLHRMADVILTLNHLRLRPDVDHADFSVAKSDSLTRHLAVGGRVVMAAAVVGNVVGLCGNVAAAVLAKQAGDLFNASSAAFAANSTDAANGIAAKADLKNTVADDAASVQQFCEVAVLLIIILAFAIVGIASARRVSSALRDMNDEYGAAGRQLRRQIVGTAAFVFVTFLLRAVSSTVNALSDALQIDVKTCNNFCDPACNNVWFVIQIWLQNTPEFQLSVMLISSPLALIVALWGITSKGMLQHMITGYAPQRMRSSRRQTVRMLSSESSMQVAAK